jgi:hypothetical protein
MKIKLPTFRKFSDGFSKKTLDESNNRSSNKLMKITEEYHQEQLKLQELQREFVGIEKEDKNKREELKKAIISQNAIVKQKEALFNKSIGDEDLKDFEI